MKFSDKTEAWVYLVMACIFLFMTVFISSFIIHQSERFAELMTPGDMIIVVFMMMVFTMYLALNFSSKIIDENLWGKTK